MRIVVMDYSSKTRIDFNLNSRPLHTYKLKKIVNTLLINNFTCQKAITFGTNWSMKALY